jgi:TorA maturation chaperone TorD
MAGDTDGAVKWVALSREMVEKHVLSWFDAFEEMALLILKTRFYRGVMTMTRGFLALDMRILDQLDAMLESR